MKKVKVTVQVTLTLPPGGELVENFRSEGEDMGSHIKAGGKLFRLYVNWMVFRPRFLNTEEEREMGRGHGWRTCDDADYDKFLSDEEEPEHPYTLEEIG
ncbi:MAG: hypothetical protein QOE70_5379 [Chthoniobacter sp.]|jgi:hypothetical protein|nr:hypothetical protein [Chthoniobacter sp.]